MELKKILTTGAMCFAGIITYATTTFAGSHTGVYGIKLLRESNVRI